MVFRERSRSARRHPKAIDAEVLKIIGESHDEAKRLLTAHRKQLDALAEALLSRGAWRGGDPRGDGLPPAPALQTAMLDVSGGIKKSAVQGVACDLRLFVARLQTVSGTGEPFLQIT